MTTVSAKLKSPTAIELSAGNHRWRADEPVSAGGTDTGPTPYDLLLGALAACTCLTVSFYAARKGIALESISASVSHDRVHSEDCRECEAERPGYLDRITGEIVISAAADEDQRNRLAQVATRCPVRRTLQGEIVFSDDVRFEDDGPT